MIAHSLRKLLQLCREPLAILKIDFRNAFNNISREAFLHIVNLYYPGGVASYISHAYCDAPILQFGDFQIHSSEGVQQGDPLSPVLFSMVLHSLIMKLEHELDLHLNLWFLDDGVIVATPAVLESVLDIIANFGFGLDLNLGKCEVFPINQADISSLDPAIKRVTELEILGIPVSHPENFGVQELQTLLSESLKMSHLQSQFLLLQQSFNARRLNHISELVFCP
ncbi:MAG: hypothetical protein RL131_17 [Bacteroidota bacterium]